jgi:hypothetical protein
MKIGILTHYDVNNQGAQLQLYALYNLLKEWGHQPVVLTYNKNYDFEPELRKRNQIGITSIPYILRNFLFAKGIGLTWHNVKKYTINRRFRLSTMHHASYCQTEVDAAIVGSDEVFSLEIGINTMMFGHGVNTRNMIAYAPSCGQTDIKRIDHFNCRELIQSGLQHFAALSARDINTKQIIEELTQREVSEVCDPAILYNFALSDIKAPSKTPKGDFIAIYSYDARFVESEEVEAIRRFAHENGLTTVSPGTYHKWCDVNIACNALEWLKCMSEAKYIITDTFHGTIAAAITNRPMALHLSQKVNSSKMTDLVMRLGLEDRMLHKVSYDNICRVFTQRLDFDKLNARLEAMRIHSTKYLKQSLSNIHA